MNADTMKLLDVIAAELNQMEIVELFDEMQALKDIGEKSVMARDFFTEYPNVVLDDESANIFANICFDLISWSDIVSAIETGVKEAFDE